MIAIVDYNIGNLSSVKNAFAQLGCDLRVESDPHRLAQYERIVLPGVGAFGDAMDHLRTSGMDEALREYARSGKWMLGICLGMQLLFESSSEFGTHEGLGLVKGHVQAFDAARFAHPLKVPHMGWNRMFTQEHPLFGGLDEAHYLYFVHSYHAVCSDPKESIGESEYGYRFTSAVAHENVLGIQPHPEKSHRNGLAILKNFVSL
ncbi:MAG: imidazole glycerol phosphate synthase subunit HisH [Campylobacterales bacterium]|nr:imidazole glycerol phosphate synthase subunit HisH [Campylobacterales bacterium]